MRLYFVLFVEDILDFWINLKNISSLDKFHIYPSLLSLFWERTQNFIFFIFEAFKETQKPLSQ